MVLVCCTELKLLPSCGKYRRDFTVNMYLDHNQFSGRIPEPFYKHPFLKEMYIEGNAFRPGVKPIGFHKMLEVSNSDFLV
ncbi:hypothetical protein RIF29_16022 [Crotalaria pallida]|uniref:Uncharacterized protein n=1 Tax=Crotalaria pallida TaxID=3830 RepID=A0AAN9FI42_CROPI